MIQHPEWGWGEIVDIRSDIIFLRFPGGFGAWFDRAEFASRIPSRMPSKSEAVVFRHMGYVVPELD